MTKKDVQLNIRMTQELKNRIEKSAKKNNRTINAEAITLIEFGLDNKLPGFNNRVQSAAVEISEQVNLSPNEIEKLIHETLGQEISKALSISLDEVLSNAKLALVREIEKHRE